MVTERTVYTTSVDDKEFDTDSLDLYVGHNCVSVLHQIVPVEFVTALVSKVMLDYNGNLNAIIDEFDWDDEFKSQLKARVKKPVECYTKSVSK